jgi:hypothetical protein
MLLILH